MVTPTNHHISISGSTRLVGADELNRRGLLSAHKVGSPVKDPSRTLCVRWNTFCTGIPFLADTSYRDFAATMEVRIAERGVGRLDEIADAGSASARGAPVGGVPAKDAPNEVTHAEDDSDGDEYRVI